MMKLLFIIIFFLQEVPYKAKDEFECKVNMSFKVRSEAHSPVVKYDETFAEREKRLSASPLPYLKINLTLLTLSETEVRFQLISNGQLLKNKKVEPGELVELDLGFTDDIKDGISPRDYEIFLVTKDRKPVSKILITFNQAGDFFVNGEKRGRI